MKKLSDESSVGESTKGLFMSRFHDNVMKFRHSNDSSTSSALSSSSSSIRRGSVIASNASHRRAFHFSAAAVFPCPSVARSVRCPSPRFLGAGLSSDLALSGQSSSPVHFCSTSPSVRVGKDWTASPEGLLTLLPRKEGLLAWCTAY